MGRTEGGMRVLRGVPTFKTGPEALTVTTVLPEAKDRSNGSLVYIISYAQLL